MQFRFAHPDSFLWLWTLPIVIGLSYFLLKQARKTIHKALGEKLTPFLTSSVSPLRRKIKIGLEATSLLFLIVALARPQMGTSQSEIKSEGVELILAVDVSSSMEAEDVKPSRLEFAKRELMKLVDRLGGDKVGVVAFAGSSALLSPMTTDKSAVKMYLDSLGTNSVSTQGTEFKKALEVSKNAFQRGGVEVDEVTAVTRVILIASDGEDQEAGALEMADQLADEGIRIFSLAFGTEKGAPIPVRDSRGNLRGYKRDSSGKTVMSMTQGTVLQDLAKSGRGSFYHATFGGRAVESLVDDINKLEKQQFDSEVVTNYGERYQIFLAFALILALIELLVGERNMARQFWRGRFEVSNR